MALTCMSWKVSIPPVPIEPAETGVTLGLRLDPGGRSALARVLRNVRGTGI
ncbi:MAG: hypothetical protein QOD61_701, partial [Solirubrobacteraceae bacterium]|nr:hypothetical protein [Solirubrobacteraceae bacterium]